MRNILEVKQMGLGKQRSKFGRWLDKRGIKQEYIVEQTKIGRNTISDICSGKRDPNSSTIKKIMAAVKKIDNKAKVDDLFF
jgi:predicted transcriptional regulator